MKIAIIGAGVTGLTAALHLRAAGHDVDIYEAQSTVGGLAGGFKAPNWAISVEYYYHHWFTSDKHILDLLSRFGWTADFEIYQPKTVVAHQGDFYPLDSLSAIFQFPGFNLWDIIRFGLVTLYLRYFSHWQSLESQTASSWLTRAYGNKIYECLWQPLLEGKFGPHHPKVTMAWMWARLKVRTPKLATFAGGFQRFLDRFAHKLTSQGVKLHLNTPITQVVSKNQQIILTLNGQKHVFDSCLVTTPPSTFLKLAANLPPALKQSWQSTISLGALILLFSLKHPLSSKGYYWFNLPKKEGFPFLALVEHTNLISPQKVNGEHLIYCGDYLDPSDPRLNLSADQLQELYLPALKKINPAFETSWINRVWLFKTPYAQPVPFINHSRKLPPIKTDLPGLYYASMAHIYPWDRGTNFAVALGEKAAKLIMHDFHET